MILLIISIFYFLQCNSFIFPCIKTNDITKSIAFPLNFPRKYMNFNKINVMNDINTMNETNTSNDNILDENDMQEVEYQDIDLEIADIIDIFYTKTIENELKVQQMNINNKSNNKNSHRPIQILVDSQILSDNAYLLCKGKIYEQVMDVMIRESGTTLETHILEGINQIVSGFITSERKHRSRLKLNYILAGVVQDKFEESIDMLVESDEIDEYLMICVDSMIQKELMRLKGPSVSMEDDEDHITGVGKATLSTLRSIQKRLKAEIDMKTRPDIRLLGKLLQEKTIESRESLLISSIKYIEDIDSFTNLVEDGIEHMYQQLNNRINYNENENANANNKLSIIISPETYEKLKDILQVIYNFREKLKTGLLTTGDIYSTTQEDYIS